MDNLAGHLEDLEDQTADQLAGLITEVRENDQFARSLIGNLIGTVQALEIRVRELELNLSATEESLTDLREDYWNSQGRSPLYSPTSPAHY